MEIQKILWNNYNILFDTHPVITYVLRKALKEMGESVALNVIGGLVR